MFRLSSRSFGFVPHISSGGFVPDLTGLDEHRKALSAFSGFVDVLGNLIHVDIRSYTEHRHIPVKRVNVSFDNIARPFFSHACVLCKDLDRLQNRNTLVDLRLVMSQIQCIGYSRFASVHEHLAFLLEVGNKLVQRCFQLKTVDYYVNSVGLYDVPQRFLRVLEGKLVFLFLFKLSSAERTAYDDTGTIVCFPFAAAMFTQHFISPPSLDLKTLRFVCFKIP